MSDVVIDTNVVVVAAGRGPGGASVECIRACIAALDRLDPPDACTTPNRLVVDDGDRIVNEYRRNAELGASGQLGPDGRFLRWLLHNQHTPSRCVRVTIHPRGTDGEDYEEFPDAPGLREFDRPDRKFVAVAMAHGPGTPILQATDAGWWRHRQALAEAGVEVDFICPEDIRRSHRARGGAP